MQVTRGLKQDLLKHCSRIASFLDSPPSHAVSIKSLVFLQRLWFSAKSVVQPGSEISYKKTSAHRKLTYTFLPFGVTKYHACSSLFFEGIRLVYTAVSIKVLMMIGQRVGVEI